MKKSIFALLFLSMLQGLSFQVQAQCFPDNVPTPSSTQGISTNGWQFTQRDTLHVLVIFRTFNNNNEDWDVNDNQIYWAHDDIPNWAKGASNWLFDVDASTIGQTLNISSWFKQMSLGNFIVTGEVFPHLIVMDSLTQTPGTTTYYDNAWSNIASTYQKIRTDYPNYHWSKFDRRQLKNSWNVDNAIFSPDGNLDYVFVIDRVQGIWTGRASIPNSSLPVTDPSNGSQYNFRQGHWAASLSTNRGLLLDYFTHEFAHNAHYSPHVCGANDLDADGIYFYPNMGWGYMSTQLPMFNTANAWDRWFLGWADNTTKTITTNRIDTLYDFMTTGDAIRIPIPGATGQFLWLENHQKRNSTNSSLQSGFEFDLKPQYSNFMGATEANEGLYAYVTRMGNDQNNPNIYPQNTEQTNSFRHYIRSGLSDHVRHPSETVFLPYDGGTLDVFTNAIDNPISGTSKYQFSPKDRNLDGTIEVNQSSGNSRPSVANESYPIAVEKINNQNVVTFAFTGTDQDAFQIGDEISLSGIVPVLNTPRYLKNIATFEPKIINGLCIKVLGMYNGGLIIDIKFNDREIRENKRWTGLINLPPASNPSAEALLVKAGKQLKVDLSGTPNRHTTNAAAAALGQPFVNPTRLTVQSNALVRLETGSEVEITQLSEVFFDLESKLVMETGSRIIVKDGGVLRLKGNIELLGNSKIHVKAAGKIIVENGSALKLLSDNAMIEIEGELVIINTQFTISGVPNDQKGFLKFHPNATVAAQSGGTMTLGEPNNFRKVLELAPNAQIALPATLAQFSINYGEVQMAPGSRLLVHTKAVFMHARFERLGTTGLHQGVLLTGNYPHQIMASRFNHASTGLELNLIGNLHQPQLLSNQFNNNQTGLYVHGGGVLIGSGSFSNNTAWGMRLLALSAASQVNNVTLNNNFSGIQVASTNSHPINIQGCSIIRNAREVSSIGIEVIQGNVNCRNNTISYHSTGIAALGQGAQLRLACNNISQADEGIAAFNFARLDLSNQARNVISNSVISTIYTDHGLLQLNHGYNDLSNNTNALPIFGIVAPNCYVLTTIYTQTGAEVFYELPAENNKFESGFYYPNAGQASISPFLETNYHVCDAFGGLTLDKSTFYPVYRKANHPNIAFLSCSQANPPWWHDVFNTVSIDGDPSTFVVNSPLYPGVELKQAIRTALNDITIDLEQPQNDSLALARFKQILTATYIDMDDSGRELLATANSAMNFALGNAYALGILPVEYGVNPEPLNDMVYTLLSSLDELIAHSDDENLRIKYALDKVLLYRLAGHYETAIAELQNSLANQHQNFGYWDCILQLEWSYFQGHIGADQFAQEAQQCMSMYQARRRRRQPPSMPNYHSTVSNALAVSPNPSNSSSTVSFTRTESPAWLQLTDAQGKLVYRLPIEVGNTQVNLNAQQLPMGVYLIELHEPAKTVLRAKWVVSK